MHYLDEFIKEQNERNTLSGYQTLIPEYIDNHMYRFDSYDDESIEYVFIQITDLIRKGYIERAKLAFDNLSDKIKEGRDPKKREKEWNFLLSLAMALDEEENEND